MKRLLIITLFFLGAAALFLFLPYPSALFSPLDNAPLKILDRHGNLLYEFRKPKYGSSEYLEDIPQNVIDALVAIEDRGFYWHLGISPTGIARSLWQNYQAGRIVSGGSTITQQLVRIRLQPEKRNYAIKIKELLLALKLDLWLSKEEILRAYLNEAYFGQQSFGITAASRTYFKKQPTELSLTESAFLIGLLQAPSDFNPYKNFKAAKARQEKVLSSLFKTEKISEEEYDDSRKIPISLASSKIEIKAPHFVFWVLADSTQKGDILMTSLDLYLQQEVESIVRYHLEKLVEKNVSSAAVVVLDAHTGEVLSMVGSADYFDEEHDGQVNVAISPRQPGSTLKPFTYALALMKGDTAATTVADIEIARFTSEGYPYIPRNYDFQYHGLVRYREALANSYNIPAIKVVEKVGVPNLLHLLADAGITTLNKSPEHYGLALTLGDGEVTLLELTKAYGMFARGGRKLDVTNRLVQGPDRLVQGSVLNHTVLPYTKAFFGSRHPPRRIEPALAESIAWLITDILSDKNARLPEFGEGGPLDFEFPVAAKTGTTRNSRDNWTIGHTPDRVVGVWVGNADNTPMRGTSGITGAGPIFHDVMEAVMKGLPKREFPQPEGLTRKFICKLSGKLPTKHCPETVLEWFIAGTEPKEEDHLWQSIALDTRNGFLANEACDPKFIEEKVFAVFSPDLRKWARENGFGQAPTQYSPLCPEVLGTVLNQQVQGVAIISPHQNDTFKLDPLIPDDHEKIIFEAEALDPNIETLHWTVNGEEVGTGKRPDFRFEWIAHKGEFEIQVHSAHDEDHLLIRVKSDGF